MLRNILPILNKIIDNFILSIKNQIIEASVEKIHFNSVLQFNIIESLYDILSNIENSDIILLNENIKKIKQLTSCLKIKTGNKYNSHIININNIVEYIDKKIDIKSLIEDNVSIYDNFDNLTILSNRYMSNVNYDISILKNMLNDLKSNNELELFG